MSPLLLYLKASVHMLSLLLGNEFPVYWLLFIDYYNQQPATYNDFEYGKPQATQESYEEGRGMLQATDFLQWK